MSCAGACCGDTKTDQVSGCNVIDPDNPVPILYHPVYTEVEILNLAGDTVLYPAGALIPPGATTVARADGSAGPDGSGFVRSYYTNAAGIVLDPATVVWSPDCSTPAAPDTEMVEFINPKDPATGLVRVWAVSSIDSGGNLTTTYLLPDGTAYDPAADGTVLVSEADLERTEECYQLNGVKTRYVRIAADEFSALYSNVAGIGGPVNESAIGTRVGCDGEERAIPGCITLDDGRQVQGLQWTAFVDGSPDPSTVRYTDTLLATAATATDTTAVDLATAVVTAFEPNGTCCPPESQLVATV